MSASSEVVKNSFADRVNAWFGEHARPLPWRTGEHGAWGVLVSEFMLQQTPVNRVLPRWLEWLTRWPTPADLAAAPPSEALRAWSTLGYPRRALWLHRAATQITEQHGGVVPSNVSALLALTGVGDYTARAVAVFAYGAREPVVDTNTRRVIARAITGQAEAGSPSAVRDLPAMAALLPQDDATASRFNAAMMELGALVCTARSPDCGSCPIRDACAWLRAGQPEYTGPRKAVQKKYHGSDRQVRGLIMRRLRDSRIPVPHTEIETLWADHDQRHRAINGLLADGLAIRVGNDGLSLPQI